MKTDGLVSRLREPTTDDMAALVRAVYDADVRSTVALLSSEEIRWPQYPEWADASDRYFLDGCRNIWEKTLTDAPPACITALATSASS